MSGDELRSSWQGRALYYARHQEQLGPALLSLLASNYDDTMPFLLRAVFPYMVGVCTPFYCSEPKIDKGGRIVADMIMRGGNREKNHVIFTSERQMEAVFRTMADKLRLTDEERVDLFAAIGRWVKADQRLDPMFDRRDPDAKRLTVH